jgi:hypothetical protein
MTESIDEACRFEAGCTNASASPTDESPASLNDVTEIRYHICCINQEGRCGARHTSESYGCDICELATAPYWLGSDPHNQSLVCGRAYSKYQLETAGHNSEPGEREFPSNEQLQVRGLPAQPDPRWEALGDLFALPFFERIWIVQEVQEAWALLGKTVPSIERSS